MRPLCKHPLSEIFQATLRVNDGYIMVGICPKCRKAKWIDSGLDVKNARE